MYQLTTVSPKLIQRYSTIYRSNYKPRDNKKDAQSSSSSSSSSQISAYSLIRYRILSAEPFTIERVDNPITQS